MTAPTAATLPDIASTRAELQRRRAELTAQRPAIALRAASGDPGAIDEARQATAELGDLAIRLEGLDLAAAEARRLDAVRQQQQAAQAAQERARTIADLRAELGTELTALELLVVELGARADRIDGMSRQLDDVETTPTHPAYRRRYLAIRVVSRLRAALAVWATLPPVGQDPRALGPGDVV